MAKLHLPAVFGHKDYSIGRETLMNSFSSLSKYRDSYADGYYPYPVTVREGEVKLITKIGTTLSKAVQRLVQNYLVDERIRNLVPWPGHVHDALEQLRGIPYSPGVIRPDFLYDSKGNPQICEINGRFIFNALHMSTYADQAFQSTFLQFKGLPGLSALRERLDRLATQSFHVVKGRETGYDIHFFLAENSGAFLREAFHLPQILEEKKSILFELHQDEMIGNLKQICWNFAEGQDMLNDPRTIFIAHDKRLLAALTDRDILGDYMDSDEVSLLEKHVIKTYVGGEHVKASEDFPHDKNEWVAKKAISGKCDGLLFGQEVSETHWADLLKDNNQVFQRELSQAEFEFYNPYYQRNVQGNLAGTIPIIDEDCFGPGLYRIMHWDGVYGPDFAQPMLEK